MLTVRLLGVSTKYPIIDVTPIIATGSDDYYVSSINRQVDQKFTYSKLILRKDFFRYLWDDAGLWQTEESKEKQAEQPVPQETP